MIKVNRLLISAVITLMAASASAQTESGQAYNRHTGFYASGNVGVTVGAIPDFFSNDNSYLFEAGGIGVNGGVGYQFNSYFAPELGVTYFRFPGNNNNSDDFNLLLGYAALKGILPLGDRFNINAKLGVSGAKELGSDEKSNVLPYMGLGMGFALTSNLDFDVGIQGTTFWGLANFGLISGGLTYHFS